MPHAACRGLDRAPKVRNRPAPVPHATRWFGRRGPDAPELADRRGDQIVRLRMIPGLSDSATSDETAGGRDREVL